MSYARTAKGWFWTGVFWLVVVGSVAVVLAGVVVVAASVAH